MVIIHTRLYQKISRLIVLGAGVSIVAMVGVFYYFSYQSYEELLTAKIERLAENLVGSLELPLWNLDQQQVHVLLTKTIEDDDLVELRLQIDKEYIVVKHDANKPLTHHTNTGVALAAYTASTQARAGKSFNMTHGVQDEAVLKNSKMLTYPVYYTVNKLSNKRELLAQLHVVYSDEKIVRMLRRHVVWIMLVGWMFFSGLAIFIAYVAKKSLEPIESLAYLLSSQHYSVIQYAQLPPATTYEVAHLLAAVSDMQRQANVA